MPQIIDDKSEHCIPFILERIRLHRQQYESKGETPPPFFVGLNGVQGAGKTTLVGSFCFRSASGWNWFQLLLQHLPFGGGSELSTPSVSLHPHAQT